MFSRQLDDDLAVTLAVPHYAESLFDLVDRNREHLRQWLPWVDVSTETGNTRAFLEDQMEQFSKSKALSELIFWKDELAGVASFHAIDTANHSTTIGYWLGRNYTGKGIMTRVVRDLMFVGVEFYGLKRFEIRCATENHASRAIPQRLGYTHEGTLRQAETLSDRRVDLEVYGWISD